MSETQRLSRAGRAALWYATRGYHVFPCYSVERGECTCRRPDCDSPGKHPRTQHGLLDATTDPARITEWWTTSPHANIAIATGPSGLVVVDIDPRHGGDDAWAALVASLPEPLPATVTTLTPSGGSHLWFRSPGGIASATNAFGPGVDCKSDGGYVLAPPSNHMMGEYRFEVGYSPREIEVAPLPEALARIAAARRNGATAQGVGLSTAQILEGVDEGQRDNALFDFACRLRRAQIPIDTARELVERAAARCRPPFPAARALEKVDRVYTTSTATDDARADDRPLVKVRGGDLHMIVDAVEAELARDHATYRIYDYAGMLVRPVECGSREDRRIARDPRAVVLRRLDVTRAADLLTRAFRWVDARGKHERDIDCPRAVAETLLSRAGDGRVPTLRGVIEAPLVRDDGSLLAAPGYDPGTQLYLTDRERWSSLAIPDAPSRAEVADAVKTLLTPFAEFPFCGDADRAVVVSAILTALQRRLLPSAPLHAFDAPVQGSGKSLLSDCVAILASGRAPTCVSDPTDEVEWRKLLTSLLLAGDPIIQIDNVVHVLRSATLAKVLTQPSHADRLLGYTDRTVNLLTNVMFLSTGNNMEFAGDIPRRVLVCRIDPRREDPEARRFAIADLREHLRERRVELVSAALTILRGHIAAGRPQPGEVVERPFGGFEKWSRDIRAAVVWAGLADPCLTRCRVSADDPDRGAAGRLLSLLHDAFQETKFSVAAVIKAGDDNPALKDALLETAADAKAGISPRRLGWWLRRHKDRVASGLCLVKTGLKSADTGGEQWVVRCLKTESTESTESVSFRTEKRRTELLSHTELFPPHTRGENEHSIRNSGRNNSVSLSNSVADIREAEIDRLAAADADEWRVEEDDDQGGLF